MKRREERPFFAGVWGDREKSLWYSVGKKESEIVGDVKKKESEGRSGTCRKIPWGRD